MNATLDKFGRIVIPKRVRDDLGIDPGTVLDIEQGDGRIVLRVRPDQPDLLREDGVLVYAGEAVGDLEEAVDTQRRRRDRDLTGLLR